MPMVNGCHEEVASGLTFLVEFVAERIWNAGAWEIHGDSIILTGTFIDPQISLGWKHQFGTHIVPERPTRCFHHLEGAVNQGARRLDPKPWEVRAGYNIQRKCGVRYGAEDCRTARTHTNPGPERATLRSSTASVFSALRYKYTAYGKWSIRVFETCFS